jgi:hypothetical protein
MPTDPIARPNPVEAFDWTRFDTDAHRAAQAACTHLIHCAVDGDTRKAVAEMLQYARTVGDPIGIMLAIGQLTGPCGLPPAAPFTDPAGGGEPEPNAAPGSKP